MRDEEVKIISKINGLYTVRCIWSNFAQSLALLSPEASRVEPCFSLVVNSFVKRFAHRYAAIVAVVAVVAHRMQHLCLRPT